MKIVWSLGFGSWDLLADEITGLGTSETRHICLTSPKKTVCVARLEGIRPAHGLVMTLHSRSKEQREAVRQLVYLVLTRDMATFNPDRFKHWIKETDSKFRKVGLMLKFEIRDRFVYFRIREIRNGRIIYQFESSTRVPFEERDVVLSYEELSPAGR